MISLWFMGFTSRPIPPRRSCQRRGGFFLFVVSVFFDLLHVGLFVVPL